MEHLRELSVKLKLLCDLDIAIVAELESIRHDMAVLIAENERLKTVNQSLEHRYSELLYAFGAYKQSVERKG